MDSRQLMQSSVFVLGGIRFRPSIVADTEDQQLAVRATLTERTVRAGPKTG